MNPSAGSVNRFLLWRKHSESAFFKEEVQAVWPQETKNQEEKIITLPITKRLSESRSLEEECWPLSAQFEKFQQESPIYGQGHTDVKGDCPKRK